MREVFLMSEDEVVTLAEKIIKILSNKETSKAKLLLLDGDLGAGKTTFTKELASLIGIDKTKVNSPTFILKKEYNGNHPEFKKLIHIDAYRFNDPKESKILKLEEDLENPYAIIAIEWPSKMKHIKPDIGISFTVIDDETREVVIEYER